ncbi:MAG: MAPEG family protein [Pseudomonadota bacterium]
MFYKALLYPLLLQVALSFLVLSVLFIRRVREFSKRRIHPDSVPTRGRMQDALTDAAASSDSFQNQFELPVLFYVAVLLAITLLLTDPLLATLAWMFVLLRYLHAAVHLTYNLVMHRFFLFAMSAIVLLMMWVRLGWLIFLQ